MYDYFIVGGGISGLYMYMKLHEQSDNIMLVEESDYFGGRIYQYHDNEISFPTGAARFNKYHNRVVSLMKQFQLLDFRKNRGISSDFAFIDDANEFNKSYRGKNGFMYIDKVLSSADAFSKPQLQQWSFAELAKKVLTKKELEFMLKASGYSGQLKHMNANDAVQLFRTGIRNDLTYYAGLFHLLIEKMVTQLHINNANMQLHTSVIDINYEEEKGCYIVSMNKKRKVAAKKVICCVPKHSLMQFTCFSPIYSILQNAVSCKSLCRVYAVFNERDVWFQELKTKIVVNNPLRYIIPMDAEKGLIMISYSDDMYCEFWKSIQHSQKKLKDEIVKYVNSTFQISIRQPKKVYVCYWECGVAYWNKGVDSEAVSQLVTNPLPNIYVCGENYSRQQSWVEGALESCERCLDVIK